MHLSFWHSPIQLRTEIWRPKKYVKTHYHLHVKFGAVCDISPAFYIDRSLYV
jgi:hypothetical protein